MMGNDNDRNYIILILRSMIADLLVDLQLDNYKDFREYKMAS